MAGKKVKTTVKAKVTPTTKKSKAIKPKIGRGTGGFLTTSIKAVVSKKKSTETKNDGGSKNG